MTSALFVTTATSEPCVNVNAWEQSMGKADHIVFDINGTPNDIAILEFAKELKPDVILYTGGIDGLGLPSEQTFRDLRKITKSVMLQGDFADPPFHPVLERYKDQDCFDLYVAMDGVLDSPVDLVTLTPVELKPYEGDLERTIRCGFTGNHVNRERYDLLLDMFGTEDIRSAVLHKIPSLVLRERDLTGVYEDYVDFMKTCEMMVNTSLAGSGLVDHVKGRVLEAAFAGCALLETAGSPTKDWFPPELFYSYDSPSDAERIIQEADDVTERAEAFSKYAYDHYTPEIIYNKIVDKL